VLWLVTPVYGRLELTRIVFEQRARMLEELALLGMQARQLVVGDDANTDTAREFGFDVLERPNYTLGRRVNDGLEWACREGGASFVAFCGSDDWHLADYFARLPGEFEARTSRWQAFVSPRGDRLAVVRGQSPYGHAPWVLPRSLLERCGFRPANDDAPNGVDGSIAAGITAAAELGVQGWEERRIARKRAFRFDDGAGTFRMVDFKGGGEQVTPFERVIRRGGSPLEFDSREPFEELVRHYPVDLVERMEHFYASRGAA
jgi:hypothetical protein